ncbi:hypothetical protein VISI1226_13596 [Vibrio sinaloensis DSM 21326]|uniref:Uncharacterized protein n=1 Tax=Vibrio sinaloensis DSM 21326 TaxID=945550 RepID=E8M6W5_PHOS4|nr:hypothetical protein VISI1226_13596 [Vibrio sinaloensis DSM 21326]
MNEAKAPMIGAFLLGKKTAFTDKQLQPLAL